MTRNIELIDGDGAVHRYTALPSGVVIGYDVENPAGTVRLLDRHPMTEVRDGGPGTYGHTDAVWRGPIPYVEEATMRT